MAAAVAEDAGLAAVPGSGSHSHSRPCAGDSEGAVGEEKDAGKKGAEAVGDSEEDGEDVFEVERILDMKTEGVRERAARGSWVGWGGRGRDPGRGESEVPGGVPAAGREGRRLARTALRVDIPGWGPVTGEGCR